MNGSKRPHTKVMRRQQSTSTINRLRDHSSSSHLWRRKENQSISHWLVSIWFSKTIRFWLDLKVYDLMYFVFSLQQLASWGGATAWLVQQGYGWQVDWKDCRWLPPVRQRVRTEARQLYLDEQSQVSSAAVNQRTSDNSQNCFEQTRESLEEGGRYEFGWVHDWFLRVP